MSGREVFPSVLSVEDGDDEEQVSPSKFNRMREQQMIAELVRADANLKAVKVFRANNEKYYNDKELRELRKKEIQEPLDEAYTVIEVLQGKLARRDDLIHKLRKYISVDMLKVNQTSFEDTKTKVIEFNQQEEHNEMVLQDSISEFEKKKTIAAFCRDLTAEKKQQDLQGVSFIKTEQLNMLRCWQIRSRLGKFGNNIYRRYWRITNPLFKSKLF